MHPRHQRVTAAIMQAGTGTAQRLGDQRQAMARHVERGGMELHELQVAGRGPRRQAQREAGAIGTRWIAGARIQGADAAGSQHHDRRLDPLTATALVAGAHARHAPLTQQQAIDIDAAAPLHVRGLLHPGAQGVDQRGAAGIAAGVHDARRAMAPFATQLQAALCIAIEHHALRLQPRDRRRRPGRQPLHHRHIVVLRTGDQRVGGMRGRAVARIERRSDAALGQRAGAAAAIVGAAQQPHRRRRHGQRRGQPGRTATHHHDRQLCVPHTLSRRPIASMRSSAARARTLTSAGISIACRRSRRQA